MDKELYQIKTENIEEKEIEVGNYHDIVFIMMQNFTKMLTILKW